MIGWMVQMDFCDTKVEYKEFTSLFCAFCVFVCVLCVFVFLLLLLWRQGCS
jgi:hypothetical protein